SHAYTISPLHLSLFQAHLPPRHLHSFPTRTLFRSPRCRGAIAHRHRPAAIAHRQRGVAVPRRVQGELTRDSDEYPLRREHRDTRSEEHTSELQSPDHLVCRLLLEKKKKK